MLRIILAAALLGASSACMGDYQKYCKDVTPGGGRIIACLSKESDRLTPACKKILAESEKK
ncbi:hypothetical protein [Bradyrhizobium genosp. P]|uniref:hypothetical protein n=1 Tax=Bradyrhizobium genosp. P TaxID=83641 RepID=UPI003CEE6AC9